MSRATTARGIVLLLHIASLLIACGLLGLAYLLPPQDTMLDPARVFLRDGIGCFAAFGALAGLGSMALRPANSESVALAISTIAAVLLFFLASGAIASAAF